MKKSRFTEQQIAMILKQVDDALSLIDDPRCNLYNISGDVDGLRWPNDGPSVAGGSPAGEGRPH